ncbi:MAG: hypothetical protein AB7R89_08885 [Dehalococcoidia bacterium]
MLYAMIQHDTKAAWTVDDRGSAGRALTAALGDVAGFISCALLDTGDGGVVSIAIYEEAAGLEEARQIVDRWIAGHLDSTSSDPATLITGEVIVQRGL